MYFFRKKDLWLSILLFILGSYCVVESLKFDESSRNYPLFLAIVIILISLQLAYKAIKKSINSKDDIVKLINDIKGPLFSIFILFVWAELLTHNVGYIPSSFIMLMLMLIMFGERKVFKTTIVSLLTTATVFTLFYVIFGIPLPINIFTHSILG